MCRTSHKLPEQTGGEHIVIITRIYQKKIWIHALFTYEQQNGYTFNVLIMGFVVCVCMKERENVLPCQ